MFDFPRSITKRALSHLVGIATICLVSVSAAHAATSRTGATGMAARAGEVVGAAAACGVPEGRLVELGKTVVALVREVARSETEIRRAQAAYERGAARGEADVRLRGQAICPAVIRTFERAEAN